MCKLNKIILIVSFLSCFMNIYAQDVNITLKNSRVITGKVIEEQAGYVTIFSDYGQVKVERQNIENIQYNPFTSFIGKQSPDSLKNATTENGQKFLIKDPVVVYLKNGNTASGLLLAKSIDMIMLQTDSGNLTIKKGDLTKIEYISSEYAERGEIVTVILHDGKRFEGNIYFEDYNNLTIDTSLGRLTLPKNKLRTVEYTGKTGMPKSPMTDQLTEKIKGSKRNILPSYDSFSAGYVSTYGDKYGPGFGAGYERRLNIKQFDGMNFSATGGIMFNYFGLNEDNILKENAYLNANLKGGAFITTFGGGGQLNIYPETASMYDLYVAAAVEGHITYRNFEQSYPSFPQLDTSKSDTEFQLGLGLKLGTELQFNDFKLGLRYNIHYIFGDDGFNQISLTFTKPLFWR